MFHLIAGKLPKTTSPKEIGRASGELNSAMEKVKIDDISGCAPPYYDLYKVHHFITRDLFYKEIASSAYDCSREPIDFLVQEIRKLEEQLGKMQARAPPPPRRRAPSD